ncbi:TPM domain-containing protein [Bifidobacterium rousetti]|uniref:TPM domain-containing protein n=1 Tax=Bifidobacterium rousetti TaxID=2045439 RepID=UPI001CC2D4FE|nr:TPM domain-containing protein [Bifidobacterium rousetti]
MIFVRFATPDASRHGIRRAFAGFATLLMMICLTLAVALAAALPAPSAFAVQTGTMTNEITDPQNLLGSNVSTVSDRIKQTEEETGVHVHLQYVESFGADDKPSQWAKQVLEATNPEPNTVLLAVASGDGNLVVAVSSNSDEWLRDEKTVDELSRAATAPLAKQDDQDWSGAAIAMMDEIKQQKQTSTNSRTIRIGLIVMGCVLVLLVIVIVTTVTLRRRNKARRGSASKSKAKGKAGKTEAGKTETGKAGDTPATSSAQPTGQSSEQTAGETTMTDLLNAIEREGRSGDAKPMTRRQLREARKSKKGFFKK